MASTSKPDTQSGQTGITRRSVAKTAAHAAWAVPAIQVAASVPAFAAASDLLAFTAGSGDWTVNTGLFQADFVDVTTGVKNNSASDATVDLSVTVTFPNVYVRNAVLGTNQTLTITNITGGWTNPQGVTYAGSGASRTGTAVFVASTQVAAGATKSLGFRATGNVGMTADVANSDADTITLAATASGHVAASTTINPTS